MRKIFDDENPVMKALAVAADLLVLNILTLLCCLPVVTAGPALTAMNDILIHMVRKEEGYIIKPYFRSFAANFKKGLVMGLLFLAAAALLYFDYLAALTYAPMLRYGIAAIAVILFAVATYAFALLSRYENMLGATLKNAVKLAVGFFPRTLGMVVFAAAFWVLAIRFYRIGAPLLLLFGLTLPGYVSVLLMNGIFPQIEQ